MPNDSNGSSKDEPKYRSAFVAFGLLAFGAVVGWLFMVAIGGANVAMSVATFLNFILGLAVGTFCGYKIGYDAGIKQRDK